MLRWTADDALAIDETSFRLRPFGAPQQLDGSDEAFLLMKPRDVVEDFTKLVADLAPVNIFELGIYRGGSVAFLAKISTPRRHVAIDLSAEPNARLERWIEAQRLDGRLHTHYGTDQADRGALRRILRDEFEGPLDLVIDDASHELEPSRISFNVLFPRLRPGGLYIIEDWSWTHVLEQLVTDNLAQGDPAAHDAVARTRDAPPPSPLTILLFELVLATAYRAEIVSEVRVEREFAVVQRGSADIDPDTFDLSNCYQRLGRDLLPRR